jgi:hypothetical protein
MANPYLKHYLMTAGPTPLPPAVSLAMAQPMLYHRAPAFVEVYARVLERLKLVFGTRNEVLLFASSMFYPLEPLPEGLALGQAAAWGLDTTERVLLRTSRRVTSL